VRFPYLFSIPFLLLGEIAAAQDNAPGSEVLFILDGSGSMWGRVNEVEKIVVAKDVMTGLIEDLPADINAGLITYGHRTRGACDDIEVIATPGTTPRAELLTALSAVTPLGKTPISDSLLRAGEVIRQTENSVSIVLVSDGIESCDGDPCATAALLREQGVDVRIHVVGFDVDAEAREQLSCIADVGGGDYYQAGSADALTEALASVRTSIVEDEPAVVLPEPTPVFAAPNIRLAEDVIGGVDVIDVATGEPIARLSTLNEEAIPAGTYQFGFDNFLSPALEIEDGQEYVISAEQFGLSVVQFDGTQAANIHVLNLVTDEMQTFLSGTVPEQYAPGSYEFQFANFSSLPFTIEANETYFLSPSDFALASVAMDGNQLKNVRVINVETGEAVATLFGDRSTRIPPATYRFQFSNFTSPPISIEANSTHVISPADYNLATVAMDGNQISNVSLIDEATGEQITSLSGQTPKLIAPGTYILEFANFTSPAVVVDENGTYTFSPLDYGLARVELDGTQDGGVNILTTDGERLLRFSGTSDRLIPPGEYMFGFDNYLSPSVSIEANSEHVVSAESYGLATVQLSIRVSDSFQLLQAGQDPIELRDGHEHQIAPGTYAQFYQNQDLGTIQVAPNETIVINVD